MSQTNTFIKDLQKYQRPGVFNPWSDYHPSIDIHSAAPQIRARQFEDYLRLRLGYARYTI